MGNTLLDLVELLAWLGHVRDDFKDILGFGEIILTFCLLEPVERPEPEDARGPRSFSLFGAVSIVPSPEDRPTPESTRLTRFKEGCCCESEVCIVQRILGLSA